ncbi:hypothetical protein ACJX0J_015843 [Zea mays]
MISITSILMYALLKIRRSKRMEAPEQNRLQARTTMDFIFQFKDAQKIKESYNCQIWYSTFYSFPLLVRINIIMFVHEHDLVSVFFLCNMGKLKPLMLFFREKEHVEEVSE